MFDLATVMGRMMDRAADVGAYAVFIGPAVLLLFFVVFRIMNPGTSRSAPRVNVRPPVGADELMSVKLNRGDIDRFFTQPDTPIFTGDAVWKVPLENIEAIRQWTGVDGLERAIVFLRSGREIRMEERDAG